MTKEENSTDQLAQIRERAEEFLRERGWAEGDEVIEDVVEFAATIRAETLEEAAKIVESHQCSELKSSKDVRPLTQMIASAIRDAGRKGL